MTEPVPGGSAPTTVPFTGRYALYKEKPARRRYDTFDAAERAAGRLATAYPGDTFIVTQEIARVKLKPVEAADAVA